MALRLFPRAPFFPVSGDSVTLLEDIPQGHKFALKDIPKNDPVVKYGAPIGYAKADIAKGAWVHTHKPENGTGDLLNYTYSPQYL